VLARRAQPRAAEERDKAALGPPQETAGELAGVERRAGAEHGRREPEGTVDGVDVGGAGLTGLVVGQETGEITAGGLCMEPAVIGQEAVKLVGGVGTGEMVTEVPEEVIVSIWTSGQPWPPQ
jgi:hypothetical protein